MTVVFSERVRATAQRRDHHARAGVHVVLGTELDGTRELVALAAGASTPRRGSVRISEQNPRSAPALRRRIGTLFAEETLPPAADGRRVR